MRSPDLCVSGFVKGVVLVFLDLVMIDLTLFEKCALISPYFTYG